MTKATWNGTVIAESDAFEKVEGNVYFPASTIDETFFEESDHQTTCGWKGVASYYHVVVDGERNENAAWYYAEPKQAAENIKGMVSFWKGIKVA